ncbi:MAG: rRNA maturation RNase YbeY [Muribaculaceae bacterium]|nr:rRNA maturation RNase YbeY [Muribaculaceae bacterium]
MIEFFAENVAMPQLDFKKIEKWIEEVSARHNYLVGNLTYCFCDDPYILDTNRKFLNHDYYTDIITFDYTRIFDGEEDFKGRISGDMVISLDTVRTNAESLGDGYTKELLRVIIHGVLHLCGINDKGPGEREIMEAEENKALLLL